MSINNNNTDTNNTNRLLTPRPPLPLPYDTKDHRKKVISAFEKGLISSPLLEDTDGIVYKWMHGQENVFIRPRKTGKTQAIVECIYMFMKAIEDEDMSFLVVSVSDRAFMKILNSVREKVLGDKNMKEDITRCTIQYEYISHMVKLYVFITERTNGKKVKVYASSMSLIYEMVPSQTAIFLDEFQFLEEDIAKNIHKIDVEEPLLAVSSESKRNLHLL